MTVSCPQCGAPVEARTDTRFYRCPFCTSSYVAEHGVGIAEYHMAHERDDRLAWSALASTLEREGADPVVDRLGCEYLVAPFWLTRPEGGGRRLAPALRHPWLAEAPLGLPGGDLLFVPEGSGFIPPDIPATEAVGEEAGRGTTACGLVHLPLYLLRFGTGGRECRAVVSAVDRRACLLDPLPRQGIAVPLRHVALVAGFALVLVVVGLAVHDHLRRAAAFAVVFGVSYPACYAFLRREA
ncbi:MAG: hypothetical protein ED859_00315 [Desulfuromonadales bacterium]|nr:MAG: hypothetical protein ED859_00315 [Desulfuromonadales bacterium]